MFVFILIVLILLASIFLLPETPKFWINSNRTAEAQRALNYIARINRSNLWFHDFKLVRFKTETVKKSDLKRAGVQETLVNRHSHVSSVA